MSAPRPFNLGDAFAAKQRSMRAALGVLAEFTAHPGAKGTATEEKWREVLREFLPNRYGVGPAFVVDSNGHISDQIDLAIFDSQYAPIFLEQDGVRFIPAESVYAVCEVKPVMTRRNLDYARAKVESVRALHRTSALIHHVGGEYSPRPPSSKPILGVFLGTRIDWASLDSVAARSAILEDTPTRLDLGVAIDGGAFDRTTELTLAPTGHELIWFASRLFRALVRLGTALAIDLDAYYLPIETPISGEHPDQ